MKPYKFEPKAECYDCGKDLMQEGVEAWRCTDQGGPMSGECICWDCLIARGEGEFNTMDRYELEADPYDPEWCCQCEKWIEWGWTVYPIKNGSGAFIACSLECKDALENRAKVFEEKYHLDADDFYKYMKCQRYGGITPQEFARRMGIPKEENDGTD